MVLQSAWTLAILRDVHRFKIFQVVFVFPLLLAISFLTWIFSVSFSSHFTSCRKKRYPFQHRLSLVWMAFLCQRSLVFMSCFYFWCYERIRAGSDLYTFDGRVLIQHIQEERIECFHFRINVIKEVYYVPRKEREFFAKAVGCVPGIASCNDVFICAFTSVCM